MAIRYTPKVLSTINQLRAVIENSQMLEDEKEKAYALLNTAEQTAQAGHLVACGRTLSAFESTTGLSVEQMKATPQYQQLKTLMPGESIMISCPRDWFNFCRALLKTDNSDMRLRTKFDKTNKMLMVTRLQ